jgi:hypothetical protein
MLPHFCAELFTQISAIANYTTKINGFDLQVVVTSLSYPNWKSLREIRMYHIS